VLTNGIGFVDARTIDIYRQAVALQWQRGVAPNADGVDKHSATRAREVPRLRAEQGE
jgi:hypothetical protein